jgi:chromosome segregation ATPase
MPEQPSKIDINQVIKAGTREMDIDSLARMGHKNVRVIDENQISNLITQAVAQVLEHESANLAQTEKRHAATNARREMQQQLSEYKLEMSGLQKAKGEEAQALKAQIADLNKKMGEADQVIDQERKRIAEDSRKEFAKLLNKAKNDLDSAKHEMELEKGGYGKALRDLITRSEELVPEEDRAKLIPIPEGDKAGPTDLLVALHDRLGALDRVVANRFKKLDETKRQLEVQEEDFEIAAKMRHEQQKELEEATKELDGIRQQFQDQDEDIAIAARMRKEIQAELEATRSELEGTRAELSKRAQNANEDLKAAEKDHQDFSNKLSFEIDELKNHLAKAQGDLKTERAQHEKDMQAASRQIEEVAAAIGLAGLDVDDQALAAEQEVETDTSAVQEDSEKPALESLTGAALMSQALQTRIGRLGNHLDFQREELEKSRDQAIAEVGQQKEKFESQIKDLQSEAEKTSKEYETFKTDKAQAQEQSQQLENQLAQLRIDADAAKTEAQQQQETLSSQIQKTQSEATQQQEAHAGQLEQLQAQALTSGKEKQELQDQSTELRSELEQLNSKLEVERTANQEALATVSEQLEQIAVLAGIAPLGAEDEAAGETESPVGQQEDPDPGQDQEDQDQEPKVAGETILSTTLLADALKGRIGRLGNHLDTRRQDLEETKQELEAKVTESAELASKLSEAENLTTETQQKANAIQEELDREGEKATELGSKLAEAETLTTETQQKANAIQEELDREGEKVTELGSKLAEAETLNTESQQKANTIQEELDQVKDDGEKLRVDLEKLTEESATATAELESARAKLDSERNQNDVALMGLLADLEMATAAAAATAPELQVETTEADDEQDAAGESPADQELATEVAPEEIAAAEVLSAEVISAEEVSADVISADVVPTVVVPAEIEPGEVVSSDVVPTVVLPAEVTAIDAESPAAPSPASVVLAQAMNQRISKLGNQLSRADELLAKHRDESQELRTKVGQLETNLEESVHDLKNTEKAKQELEQGLAEVQRQLDQVAPISDLQPEEDLAASASSAEQDPAQQAIPASAELQREEQISGEQATTEAKPEDKTQDEKDSAPSAGTVAVATALGSRISRLGDQAKQSRKDLAERQEQLVKAKAKTDELRADIEKLKTERQGQVAEARAETQNLRSSVKELEHDIKTREEDLQLAADQRRHLENHLAGSAFRMSSLVERVQKSREERKRLANMLETLKADDQNSKKEMDSLFEKFNGFAGSHRQRSDARDEQLLTVLGEADPDDENEVVDAAIPGMEELEAIYEEKAQKDAKANSKAKPKKKRKTKAKAKDKNKKESDQDNEELETKKEHPPLPSDQV